MSDRWFHNHRMEWISETLHIFGFINREHIERKFGLSTPQASTDLRDFQRLYPGEIRYDKSEKCYVADTKGAPIRFASTSCSGGGESPEAGRRDALADIAAERKRQVEQEGWTAKHDDQHGKGELALVASLYADPAPALVTPGWPGGERERPVRWPSGWATSWWKPKDRRGNLVRAGALIAAEIDRLDRCALSQKEEAGG